MLLIDQVDTGKLARARELVRALGSALIAYSGGVDSSLLLKLALEELGPQAAVAALASSPAYPEAGQREARELAGGLGARLFEVETREVEQDSYRANRPDRCFHCRQELFATLEPLRQRLGLAHLAYGAMADDALDHRPGHGAAVRHGVKYPLLEAGLGKADIRAAARQLGLPNWSKPSAACLSSRVPHGTKITIEILNGIERAEAALERMGLAQVRVRHHEQVARIEVPEEDISRLVERREDAVRAVKSAGYEFVAVDLEGYSTGNLNRTWRPRP